MIIYVFRVRYNIVNTSLSLKKYKYFGTYSNKTRRKGGSFAINLSSNFFVSVENVRVLIHRLARLSAIDDDAHKLPSVSCSK